jgi:hypothetical protein
MVANLADPGYALELSSLIPTVGPVSMILGKICVIFAFEQSFEVLWCRALISFLILQPRATLKFPLGEVSLLEREDEEVKRTLSVNGILKGQILNGVCTAQYSDEDLKLRYIYKVGLFKKFDFFPHNSM